MSHLDYYNRVLYRSPDCEIKTLQSIQNSAARLVTSQCKFDEISAILYYLHLLSSINILFKEKKLMIKDYELLLICQFKCFFIRYFTIFNRATFEFENENIPMIWNAR